MNLQRLDKFRIIFKIVIVCYFVVTSHNVTVRELKANVMNEPNSDMLQVHFHTGEKKSGETNIKISTTVQHIVFREMMCSNVMQLFLVARLISCEWLNLF